MRRKLQGFDYDVKHIPGKSNISDYMSRHLNMSSYEPTKQEREKSLDCVSIEEMQYHTARDTTLSKIREILRKEEVINGNDVMVYNELYVANDLIMRHNKIIVPESLRYRCRPRRPSRHC